MAEKGATGRRTRWIGCGFSPGKPCGSAAKTAPAQRPAPRSHNNVRPCMLNRSVALAIRRRTRNHGARRRIEVELVVPDARTEVKQVGDRPGAGIEGAAAETLAVQPVVLDEAYHRGLRDPGSAGVGL